LESLDRYESEAERLARCIAILGEANVASDASWSLGALDKERASIKRVLTGAFVSTPFIACNVGGKIEVKDWGRERWQTLLSRIAIRHSQLGFVIIGASDERERGDELCRHWIGPTLNLSGELTPRESAAVLEKAALFIGHDSGPMHLAAAVGVPCVAIFSARDKPGVWFPHGEGHKVLYHQTHCHGCRLTTCEKYGAKCITSITVEEVQTALDELLSVPSTPEHMVEINDKVGSGRLASD
jgi:ADP-heptose:LPS heptosyltransferase